MGEIFYAATPRLINIHCIKINSFVGVNVIDFESGLQILESFHPGKYCKICPIPPSDKR